jgi:hypothetical protein
MDRKERFLAKVSQSSGCWMWTAGRFERGYGAFQWQKGKVVKAHRAAWTLFKGEIPEGLFVCHKCDEPLCVNPEHLFLGTARDNSQDMIAKGRGKYPGPTSPPKGTQHHKAKLTEAEVLQIRAIGYSARMIDTANAFGISEANVSSIVRKETWKHLGP